ncbi:TIGR02281 family clan AA aspartic protease [Temperatibacter marinus]|uniref:TIGR02281 family clan AA aspartic protease n=1 Tax=Temperatibacter marinus TaxID=1456591 RepID=A0AA52EBF6_9PROT|nr:TIGR02281 family clan AA aspartic protease [Temperatibacter marinus]WND02252.1 TIGR02281 family clan AA aspartic protease [Temperatibacter marinus]
MTQKSPWDPQEDNPQNSADWDDMREGLKPQDLHYSRKTDGFRQDHESRAQGGNLGRLLVFLIALSLLIGGLALVFPETNLYDSYLWRGILVAAIFGGVAVYWSRSSLFRVMKSLGIWILIIGGLSMFYVYQSDFSGRFMSAVDPSGVSREDGTLVIQRSIDGHFWVKLSINGQPLRMMVDTGASNIVLSPQDAEAIGINLNSLVYDRYADTANGRVKFARTRAKVIKVGQMTYYDVPITINGSEMSGSLLGNTLLNQYSSIEIKKNYLYLRP